MNSQKPIKGGLQDRISRRAVLLWREAGRPDGQFERFRKEAETQELTVTQPAELGMPDEADDPARFGGF